MDGQDLTVVSSIQRQQRKVLSLLHPLFLVEQAVQRDHKQLPRLAQQRLIKKEV